MREGKGNWKWSFGRNGENHNCPSWESNPGPQQTRLRHYYWATETSDTTRHLKFYNFKQTGWWYRLSRWLDGSASAAFARVPGSIPLLDCYRSSRQRTAQNGSVLESRRPGWHYSPTGPLCEETSQSKQQYWKDRRNFVLLSWTRSWHRFFYMPGVAEQRRNLLCLSWVKHRRMCGWAILSPFISVFSTPLVELYHPINPVQTLEHIREKTKLYTTCTDSWHLQNKCRHLTMPKCSNHPGDELCSKT